MTDCMINRKFVYLLIMCIVFVVGTLNVRVLYNHLRRTTSGDRYLDSIHVLSIAHVVNVLEDT